MLNINFFLTAVAWSYLHHLSQYLQYDLPATIQYLQAIIHLIILKKQQFLQK